MNRIVCYLLVLFCCAATNACSDEPSEAQNQSEVQPENQVKHFRLESETGSITQIGSGTMTADAESTQVVAKPAAEPLNAFRWGAAIVMAIVTVLIIAIENHRSHRFRKWLVKYRNQTARRRRDSAL